MVMSLFLACNHIHVLLSSAGRVSGRETEKREGAEEGWRKPVCVCEASEGRREGRRDGGRKEEGLKGGEIQGGRCV